MPALTPPARRRARHTTCWRRASGPGTTGPLQLVAQVGGAAQQAAFAKVVGGGRRDRRRRARLPADHDRRARRSTGGRDRQRVSGRLAAGRLDERACSTTLRGTVVPAASAGTGVHVLIGGQTAIFADFSSVLSGKLPLFIGVVVLLSFLLLTAVFRSLVIPATAALMNMLSAAAAFGVVTAVFQFGWFASLLGIDSTGPIEAFIPVMMFAILFGLSMDYEVFLVTRIYEEWHRTRRQQRSPSPAGLAATGRTITAAAAIMILVFGSFILGGQLIIEMFGVGLASAVLLDALIIRSILVPGLMLILGKANWALPRRLDRVLPHLNVEGDVDRAPPSPPSPPRARPRAARSAPVARHPLIADDREIASRFAPAMPAGTSVGRSPLYVGVNVPRSSV